jgi:hypothetical protein
LGESIHAIKKIKDALVVASKEIGLEINADKTKYIVIHREQNARHIHYIKADNSLFERVEQFKCLGTTLTNQNCIREESKSRLNSGNACYMSVQYLLCYGLLSTNLKIKIYRTIILPVLLHGCETWSLKVREERFRIGC